MKLDMRIDQKARIPFPTQYITQTVLHDPSSVSQFIFVQALFPAEVQMHLLHFSIHSLFGRHCLSPLIDASSSSPSSCSRSSASVVLHLSRHSSTPDSMHLQILLQPLLLDADFHSDPGRQEDVESEDVRDDSS